MAITSPPYEADDKKSDVDSDFDEDMEALRETCILTGTKPDGVKFSATSTAKAISSASSSGTGSRDDNLDLAQSIHERFSGDEPLSLEPLSTYLPGSSDNDEDDFETLRAIKSRFDNYDSDAQQKNTESYLNKSISVYGTSIAPEQESFKTLPLNSDCEEALGKEFPDFEDRWHQSEASHFSHLKPSDFLVEAIKKNRLYQKTLRNKMIEIEARIEENRKLKEHVQLLKDFQVSCKKRAGRALSLKKDARIQLISAPRPRKRLISKVNDKKHPSLLGPVENYHVANYRMVLEKCPVLLRRERWSKSERENLQKGIKQQFQEMLVQKSMELYSGLEESVLDANGLDNMIAPITDFEIKPEDLRTFLPKVNWERLASMYVVGRSGAECEARWLNWEDPLINSVEWTKTEDKKLLYTLQQRGLYNWVDIAITSGTNRTPCQCFIRYQRSLNAHIMRRDWTEDEDAQLRAAVEAFGGNDWQLIASRVEGRFGTQCYNRWKHTLNPARFKVGRWDVEEDKHLKVAVMLFGPRAWNKIAQFVPGRTQMQCRERWVNVLNPSLNLEPWTEEEDSRLKAAIAEHGHRWSKVAECVPPRSDSQCRRRWKVLLPHEVPVLQEARRIQKTAFRSNFVDREKERSTLCASDFLPLMIVPGAEPGIAVTKEKQKRGRPNSKKRKDVASCDAAPQKRTKRSRAEPEICPGGDSENFGGGDGILKKKVVRKARSSSRRCPDSAVNNQELSVSPQPSRTINLGNGEISYDENYTSKKKPQKLCSKRKRRSEPALDHQELPLCPGSSPALRTTNTDVDETSKGDDSKKKKKIPNPCPKTTRFTKPAREHDDVSNGNVAPIGDVDGNLKRKRGSKQHLKRNASSGPGQDQQGCIRSPVQSTPSGITGHKRNEGFHADDSIQKKTDTSKTGAEIGRCIGPSQEQNTKVFP